MMAAQRIILVNDSRLLGDMLHTIIDRTDHLEVVQEICGDEELPDSIEKTEADWVILSLPSPKSMPGWIDQYLIKHPFMRILALSPGSDKVRLFGLEDNAELEDLSLNDLICVLQGRPLARTVIKMALQVDHKYRVSH